MQPRPHRGDVGRARVRVRGELPEDAVADSPWVSSYRIDDVLPFNLKKLKALLRARGVGRVVVKKRGSPIEPEALARQLRGPGSGSAVVVVTRVAGVPTVLVCGVDSRR